MTDPATDAPAPSPPSPARGSPSKTRAAALAGGVEGACAAALPKVARLPARRFAGLFLWVAVPPLGYILLCTNMGFADQVYYYMSEQYGEYGTILLAFLCVLLLVLYLFDAEHWSTTRTGSLLLYPAAGVAIVASWLYILLINDDHPYGNVCLFALLNPIWLLLVKSLFYPKVEPRTFVSWLGGPFMLASFLCVASWAVWVLWDEEHEWNEVTRTEAAVQHRCAPDFETYPTCQSTEEGAAANATCFSVADAPVAHELNVLVFPEGCAALCTKVYSNCLNGFLPWAGPLLVAVILVFLGFCSTFLRTEGTDKGDVLNFGKVWIFIVLGLWITASFSGSSGGVMPALMALTLASFMGVLAFVAASFSLDKQKANVRKVLDSIEAKYGHTFDWARGLLVLGCAPLLVAYLGLSAANQAVRRCGACPCSKPASSEDGEEGEVAADVFTKRTRRHITAFHSWDRAKVFTYAVYLGFALITMQVLVSKMIVLFLSWLIQATADVNLGIVTGIMAGVGVLMFLIPVVPGIPVYLTVGIVLPAKAYELMGWPLAIAYATGVALVLKLASSALQQKAIGQSMSGYVKVRQAVSVNSPLIKSMRLILGEKGLTIAKVGVLVGGPDWPTSVLCGILKLELLQIVIGTMPVISVILPTCVSGAFLYMKSMVTDTGNPQYVWADTAFVLVTAFSTMVQFGALLVAMYYIEFTTSQRADELALIPVDEEVKDADERDSALKQCYVDVTQWQVVPLWPKVMLQASLACVIASSYLSMLFSSKCFEVHGLTDTIEDNLGGKWHNIIKPLGWVVLGLFVAAIVFLAIFMSWGKKQAAAKVSRDASAPVMAEIENTDACTPLLQEEAAAEGGHSLL